MYYANINGSNYTLKDGFVLKDELNETLDSGIITFYHGGDLDAESFDIIELKDSSGRLSDKTMLVDSYDPSIYSYSDSYDTCIYEYNLTLFSETKELERIVLPNISITQPIDPDLPKKTVLQEISRILSVYLPKIRVGTNNNWTFRNMYETSPKISNLFGNVECPEFQWNKSTLREVLNDLMSTRDCIVTVKNRTIDCINLKDEGNEIDTTKLLYSKRTMNSADYATDISIDMKNAIGSNATTCSEYLTFKAPNGETNLTTENQVFRTQHPIYEIESMQIFVRHQAAIGTNKYYWYPVNILGFIKEEEEWNLLSSVKINHATASSIYNRLDSENIEGLNVKLHKSNFIYYKRGSNEIYNFAKLWDAFGLNETFFENVVVELERLKTPGTFGAYSLDEETRNVLVKIQYKTIAESSMKFGKYLPNKHANNSIIDNQNNSFIDTNHESIFEYAKVNRLGNKIREIGGNYKNDTEVPQLGDRIGNEILFSRELSYWDGFVQFKGYLAPNYILKDFFTGVRAKKRSWQIANESESFTRNDNYKLFVEASLKIKRDDLNIKYNAPIEQIAPINTTVILARLLSGIQEEYQPNKQLKYAVVRTADENGVIYPVDEDYGITLDTTTEVNGMSLCFNFGYNDNFKSADYIQKNTEESSLDYRQNFYKYANIYGEFETHSIYLVRDFEGLGNGNEHLPKGLMVGGQYDRVDETTANNLLNQCLSKPLCTIDSATYENEGFKMSLLVKKDNREIIKHTIQFEYCSDTEDIIVKKGLIDRCEWINKISSITPSNLRLHYSTTDKISLVDDKDNSDYELLDSTNVSVIAEGQFTCEIRINPHNITSSTLIKHWSITDSDNNILLAANTNNRSVYFNILRSRDTNIYNEDLTTPSGTIVI